MEGRHFAYFGTLVVLVLVCAAPSTVSGASRFKRQAPAQVGLNANITANFTGIQQAFNALLNISTALPNEAIQALTSLLQNGSSQFQQAVNTLTQAAINASAANQQIINNFLAQLQNASQAGNQVLNQTIQQLASAFSSSIQGLSALGNVSQTLLTQLANIIATQNPFTPLAAAANNLTQLLQSGALTAPLLNLINTGALTVNATGAQILNSLSQAGVAGISAGATILSSFLTAGVTVLTAPINFGLGLLGSFFSLFG